MLLNILKFGLLAIAVIAVAGAVLTRKTFHVEQVIAAPPEDIWSRSSANSRVGQGAMLSHLCISKGYVAALLIKPTTA